MPEGFYRDVIKELKALGYAYADQAKGSHEKWKAEGREILIVPHNLPSRHTANAILKKSWQYKEGLMA
jgi:predicted RNA binding protein YcfA (HicA-like mRNA interferase family)